MLPVTAADPHVHDAHRGRDSCVCPTAGSGTACAPTDCSGICPDMGPMEYVEPKNWQT